MCTSTVTINKITQVRIYVPSRIFFRIITARRNQHFTNRKKDAMRAMYI